MKNYLTPVIEELSFSSINLICGSPSPGTNEQISIEDWGELINNE